MSLPREGVVRKVYVVDLSEEERTQLLELTRKGTAKARRLRRAQILLAAGDGATDATSEGPA